MITYLQNYWWFLISVLGALLVFLLFVQGGQTILPWLKRGDERSLAVNALGRKWELTFTTLVVFGGAFFASFPLFYSTSFGGAWALWMTILFCFIVQAVSYEFRRKRGNLYGTATFDTLLFINGSIGSLLLGVAVATMIFGSDFTVNKANITDISAPIISTWGNPLHGLEAVLSWRCLLLGLAVMFLARMMGAMYLMGATAGSDDLYKRLRRQAIIAGVIFVPLFVLFLAVMLMTPTQVATPTGMEVRAYGYLANFTTLWWAAIALLIGVIAVLAALMGVMVNTGFKRPFLLAAIGVLLVVMSLFWVMGYDHTSYYPSVTDPASSLTLANSSSSEFTLTVMSWVSLIIPFVAAYIGYVWYRMGKKPLTEADLKAENHY